MKMLYMLTMVVYVLFVGASTLVGPQAVGMCCFLLVLMGCLIFGYCGAVWMAHFVFLSFLGGLSVIFLYTMSVAPNPLFHDVYERVEIPVKVGLFFSLLGLAVLYWSDNWSYFEKLGSNYLDIPYGTEPLMMSSTWVGGETFLWLGFVVAICMVGITKLCSYQSKGCLRGFKSSSKDKE